MGVDDLRDDPEAKARPSLFGGKTVLEDVVQVLRLDAPAVVIDVESIVESTDPDLADVPAVVERVAKEVLDALLEVVGVGGDGVVALGGESDPSASTTSQAASATAERETGSGSSTGWP